MKCRKFIDILKGKRSSSSRCSNKQRRARLRLNEEKKSSNSENKVEFLFAFAKAAMDGNVPILFLGKWHARKAKVFSPYKRLSNIKCDSFIYFSARFIEFYNVDKSSKLWRFDNTSIVECYIDLPIEVPLKRIEMQEKIDSLTYERLPFKVIDISPKNWSDQIRYDYG